MKPSILALFFVIFAAQIFNVMDFITLLLLAIGLCFDSFAVSLSCGMQCPGWRLSLGFRFALILGVMQGVMPVLGWFLSIQFSGMISAWDHWVAFVMLSFLGAKMIYAALSQGADQDRGQPMPCSIFTFRRSFTLGLATSVDALASGVVIAFLPLGIFGLTSVWANLLIVFLVIALVTVVASLAGLKIGTKSNSSLGAKAEILGGGILIALGIKVLVEHMFF